MITLQVKTSVKQGLVNITTQVQRVIRESGVAQGVCTLYVPHTTAAITINESADPSVKEDVITGLKKLVPQDPSYRHLEGNSHAHIQAILVGNSVQVFIEDSQLKLGTWQGIFFCEFDGPRTRDLWVKVLSDE